MNMLLEGGGRLLGRLCEARRPQLGGTAAPLFGGHVAVVYMVGLDEGRSIRFARLAVVLSMRG